MVRTMHLRVGWILLSVLMAAVLLLAPTLAPGQFNPVRVDNSFSSEWEATAFNNARRMVRDADGYLHTVWHSKPTTGTIPTGAGCSIYYAYSTQPCNGVLVPSQIDWVKQEIVPIGAYPYDNRYPALVIEHGTPANPKTNDVLHLVWQRDGAFLTTPGNGDYQIWYMNTVGQDINIAGGFPAVWNGPLQIWNNPGHHDLVPSIACNYDNHLHLSWQSEAWAGGASQVVYARSVDHGATWTDNLGAALSTFGGAATPFNLSNSLCSSQMPSIACIVDAPTNPTIQPGQMSPLPPTTVASYTYTTNTVHIAWHDKSQIIGGPCNPAPGNYSIFYSYSPDDGTNWIPAENVTAMTSGDYDTYPSLTVDYFDQPHLAFMHNCNNDHDPDPPSPLNYLAGVNPASVVSFPGPDPVMYSATITQFIIYTYRAWTPPLPGGMWAPRTLITAGPTDDEFPSIAMDEQMGIHLAWQSWGSLGGEYVIMVAFNGFMAGTPGFGTWTGWGSNWELTFDGTNDDLFPSEAHKKLAMYSGGLLKDVDLVWTRIAGLGVAAAISGNQEVWYLGGTMWSDPPPVFPTPTSTPPPSPTPAPSPTGSRVEHWKSY